MSERPWYKHFPTDFVHGVVGLGAAEIGAYIIILDLIYDRGAPIPNDPFWIGGILGESSRRARSLIRKLIEEGKLFDSDGCLDNLRARKEREFDANLSRKSSEAAANAARARWSRKQNQDVNDAESNASRARVQYQIPDKEEISPDGDPKKKLQKGTRLPPDWQLPDDDEAWAISQGLSRDQVRRTALRFKNYWFSKTRDATKLDWSRTWQNWVLKDIDDKRPRNGTGPPHAKPKTGSAKLTDLLSQPLGDTYANYAGRFDERSQAQGDSFPPLRAIRDG